MTKTPVTTLFLVSGISLLVLLVNIAVSLFTEAKFNWAWGSVLFVFTASTFTMGWRKGQ